MKKTRLPTLAVLIIAATAAFGQGPRTTQHQNTSNHPAAVPDMTKARTVSGMVGAVDSGYGMQYPSITVNQSVIKVAPVWFLVDQNFELKAGDQVSVVAAPSTIPGDSYLYAIEIANIASKTRIVLRDAAGVPLWTATNGARGGNAAGPGNGIGCLDLTTVNTAAGTVEKVSMGIGIQMPSLVVKTTVGALVSMKLGPERVLLAADFELKTGDTVSAKYAHETCTDENVALQLTNSAGVTITLRNGDGTPNWN
jgi:molybdopterin converting factor small subunit